MGVNRPKRKFLQQKKFLLPLCLGIISLFIFLYLHVQVLKVDGSSMEPTLHSGQYIVSTDLFPVHPGDIAVVHFASRNNKENFVKRIVAMAGQTISIESKTIYIDGIPQKIGSQNQDWSKGTSYSTNGLAPGPPLLIPKGWTFVLGDNRDNSMDSRELGFAKLAGRVVWSFNW